MSMEDLMEDLAEIKDPAFFYCELPGCGFKTQSMTEIDTHSYSHKFEKINHPAHYNQGKIEVIDFIDDKQLGFYEGNICKYVCRAKHKGSELEDLKKAKFYLDRLILLKESNKNDN